MATTYLSGYVHSPTINVWQDLIAAPAGKILVVRVHNITNTAAGATVVDLNVTDSVNTILTTLISQQSIAAGATVLQTQHFIMLQNQEKLRVRTTVAGTSFAAWGGYE